MKTCRSPISLTTRQPQSPHPEEADYGRAAADAVRAIPAEVVRAPPRRGPASGSRVFCDCGGRRDSQTVRWHVPSPATHRWSDFPVRELRFHATSTQTGTAARTAASPALPQPPAPAQDVSELSFPEQQRVSRDLHPPPRCGNRALQSRGFAVTGTGFSSGGSK